MQPQPNIEPPSQQPRHVCTNLLRTSFRKKRLANEKRIKSYQAVKLCRLAVRLSAREMHIGSYLIDFIKAYFLIDNKTGCRLVTVDAYRSAIPFYEKNGFLPLLAEDDGEMTRLLYFDLADYQESFNK